jgi:hypothetical protein
VLCAKILIPLITEAKTALELLDIYSVDDTRNIYLISSP